MKRSRNKNTKRGDATGASSSSSSSTNKGADGRGGGNGVVQINLDVFAKRLERLVRSWADYKEVLWRGVDAIAVVTPPFYEDRRYLKSSALHIWLFEYELPDTVMMFLPGYLHILCSHNRVDELMELRKCSKMLTGVEVVLHPKDLACDGRVQMQNILDGVKLSRRKFPEGELTERPIVGHLQKGAPDGALMKSWSILLQESGFKLVNVAGGFSELFAVKDESEIKNIKKASFHSLSVLKLLVVPDLEAGIDNEKSISHAELSANAKKLIMDPARAQVTLGAADVDICYPPVFQSGGTFDLKFNAISNNDPVSYHAKGVIICALGARYKSYCSNIARTYLIDPDEVQKKAYKVLLKAQQQAINTLTPGRTMSAVYQAALAVVERDGPEFLPHLTKNAGTGIGIELRESKLTLSARNEQLLKAGMVFNIVLGFRELETPTSNNPKICKFSLLLADTVVVLEQGPDITTGQCSRSDVVYRIKYEVEEREITEEVKE